MDPEPVPDSPPYTVTVTWSVGDALVVDYPDLHPWEARAVLEEAIEMVRLDENSDREDEEVE
jgi:hypothetical protein